jgi:hypothetical protein
MPARRLLLAALAAALLAAAPADAAPLFASRSPVARYWASFKDYWTGAFRNQGAVTLAVLGTGALAMFIITRGKWRK